MSKNQLKVRPPIQSKDEGFKKSKHQERVITNHLFFCFCFCFFFFQMNQPFLLSALAASTWSSLIACSVAFFRSFSVSISDFSVSSSSSLYLYSVFNLRNFSRSLLSFIFNSFGEIGCFFLRLNASIVYKFSDPIPSPKQKRTCSQASPLAEVSHGQRRRRGKWETSAGLRRVSFM